ncbi:PLP-dependent aminotransferase family protein [Actinomadura sp. ATCC 31491]|uniref:PLP-dependent aminotransferase family protein n=1 Tax=Actinomadura luzonensis TaxID=2805427 RepID=A0ABT0FZ94_9ACTN|nr:PLP-dependent aminotransferase family protein [Actinomadura luzonensis]MCK2217670.1 PLP-dependent aminotransferase family protein [Actinomadura luzonensis]
MRTAQRLTVPIQLDRDLPEPLQAQLTAQLRDAIRAGRLAPRTRMPSTRTLAAVLGVSRGVVLAAYERLLADGSVEGRHGSGTYVAGSEPAPPDDRPPPPGDLIDLRRELPSTQAFPLAAWRAAWRRAGHQAPPADEPPPGGLPELRAAIAAYLREARGLVLDRHEILVAAGQDEALELLLRGRGRGRPPVIALEDPAPPQLRAAYARLGTVLPLPADGMGARPDLVPRGCDVVAVLPERGTPLGTRLPLQRRRALAAWARRSGGLVIEPAFDGLFDAGVNPLPSVLAAGAGDGAAMVGTFRDVLTPSLRLAFAVAPRQRPAGPPEEGGGPGQASHTCQLAVADLLASGAVARRAARLTGQYAAKRALVRQALAAYPGIRLLGAGSGASATLLLPDEVEARAVLGALRERRVAVAELSAFYQRRGGMHVLRNGLVLHYGHLDGVTLRRALRVLTRTLGTHRPGSGTAAWPEPDGRRTVA